MAGWCAYAIGIACIIGIVFLVALYVALFTAGTGFGFGTTNDIVVIVQYALALPILLALYQFLRPYGPAVSLVSTLAGAAGILAVIVLQTLLVVGILTFEQQVGMVIVAFMLILAWFVVAGNLARSTDTLPQGMFLYVMAGLYFGYTVWAFSLGRRLLRP